MMDELFRMLELTGKGFQCSQILLALGLEAQGKENPDLLRAMGGLTGGVGSCGDLCGALAGGACLLALYAGKGTPEEEADHRLILMIDDLVEWFTGEYTECYGGIHCRDIIGYDRQNQATRCPGIVSGTYDKVKEILVEYGFDLSEGR